MEDKKDIQHKNNEPKYDLPTTECVTVCREDCGKEISSQSVLIDFTTNSLDNDTIQLKCVELWELLDSNEELKNLLNPIPKTRSAVIEEFTESNSDVDVEKREHTAISMLELANKKGLFDQVLKQKLPQAYCSIKSVEDFETVCTNGESHEVSCQDFIGCECMGRVPRLDG